MAKLEAFNAIECPKYNKVRAVHNCAVCTHKEAMSIVLGLVECTYLDKKRGRRLKG